MVAQRHGRFSRLDVSALQAALRDRKALLDTDLEPFDP